ncbi:hypothetical protein L1S34_03825 [Flavobacterium sp. K77]|jgi:hypothetical protein|uniref:hypothetical protein n=1 Tax=Flavobacterium sp. K77 TaxID=2910676 RepID=UPI001F21E372|nr:hypothetical protein [Flavobacterium sp. K77]MCF6140404.1 hypothetical protein [Flavobacterium sp. K77]
MEGIMILMLILIVFGYWLTPLILIILGLTRLKSKPENAKNLFIISVVMLVVGAGFCGVLIS